MTLYLVFDLDEIPDFYLPGVTVCAAHRGNMPDFIPHGTDMIRSWGFYLAWLKKHQYTLSLDDDVKPSVFDPFEQYERVFEAGAVLSDYLDVGALTTFEGQMRGFPYRDRQRAEVGLQAGGWSGVLDFDAATQLAVMPGQHSFRRVVVPVPRGSAVTVCAMNMAFRTALTPVMWQLPLVDGLYNRFGDIWAGLFAKRALDAAGYATVINGLAMVRHDRASDPIKNLEREAPGIALNEGLWRATRYSGTGDNLLTAYRIVTAQAALHFGRCGSDPSYPADFIDARNAWLALFA